MKRTLFAIAVLALAVPASGQTPAPARTGDYIIRVELKTDRLGYNAALVSQPGADAFSGFLVASTAGCTLSVMAMDLNQSGSLAQADQFTTSKAEVGWLISGKVLERSGDEFLVQLDWQRQWDHFKRVTDGPHASRNVTIHPGDRLPLDAVTTLRSSTCQGTSAKLEVAIVPAEAVTQRAAMTRGATAIVDQRLLVRPSQYSKYDAQVWLVHVLPDGQEESQRRTVHLRDDASTFLFSTVTIQTPRGPLDVNITGSVQPKIMNDAGAGLAFTFNRRVTGAINRIGSTGKTIDFPDALDVIAFELPALFPPSSDPLANHRFSLRVQVLERAK